MTSIERVPFEQSQAQSNSDSDDSDDSDSDVGPNDLWYLAVLRRKDLRSK